MKASKFTEAQIAFVLRQAEDGTATGEVRRKAGISEATFYTGASVTAGCCPRPMLSQTSLQRSLIRRNSILLIPKMGATKSSIYYCPPRPKRVSRNSAAHMRMRPPSPDVMS